MLSNFANITRVPELRRRILFTLGMLAVYRIGVFITIPGVNREKMMRMVGGGGGGRGGILGLFNVFTGGALERMSIFALGIMPYISASIIIQLLQVVVPTLTQLSKEGEVGRQKINQYTRYGTIVLSIVQGVAIGFWLRSQSVTIPGLVVYADFMFIFMTVLTLTCGAVFLMWLGEKMTEHGIGNGISLLIYAGIIAAFPSAVASTIDMFSEKFVELLILVAFMVLIIGVIVFFERAHRRIPVQYAKRVVGNQVTGGQSSHLPLKVNTAGVIPPIFASSVLMFPATVSQWIPVLKPLSDNLRFDGLLYNTIYIALTVFFAYFYTAVTFNPIDVADNIKKFGGYIPGYRPGKQTAEYIDFVLSRITFAGAIYLSAVCVLPNILIAKYGVPFYFGGTSLLIVVGVALDTVQQIESHLITRHYEGLTGSRSTRIRGRNSSAA
ncbi:MAG: preprotein translocase subunit SecY [Myxococcales bacterium]|nr:preprotein translocase subunit SecY [Myxococcales bacterium]